MKKNRAAAAVALAFVAGMATMVAIQSNGWLLPLDFEGNIHPLFAFARAVYPIALAAIGGLAVLLYKE